MADTSVTALTLITNSIARAKDESKNQWSDAQLLKFLNKAYDHVHKLLVQIQSEIAKTDETVTMVADTQEYSLADNLPDFWAMATDGVYFPSIGIPLTPVTYEEKIRAAAATTDTAPDQYYVTATMLGVIDTPTAAAVAANSTLHCRYYKQNTALSLGSPMPYKNLFNEPMSSFMDHLALVKKTDPAEEITALYNALEEATLKIAQKRVPV